MARNISSGIVGALVLETGIAPAWKLAEIIKEWFETLPATVVKFNQNVRQYNLLSYFIKALKTTDVIFVDIFVEGSAKRNVTSDARNPFIDATFDLRKIG